MSERLRPLCEGLGPSFDGLERRARATITLAARVRAALQGPEKDHVISAVYRGDTLVVLVDSAVWCPQIHYAQQRLLERLRTENEKHVTKLKVKVARPTPAPSER